MNNKSSKDVLDRQDGIRLTAESFDRDIHLPRLVRLAEHLEEVQRRDPASFGIAVWLTTTSGDEADLRRAVNEWPERWETGEELDCNTVACMVGHLPLVFPDDWFWNADLHTVETQFTAMSGSAWMTDNLQKYFGLMMDFWYDAIYEDTYYWGGEDCEPGNPSAGEMASLIRAAIEVADAETAERIET